MTARLVLFAAAGLALTALAVRAGKVPLTPEQLQESSALIVTGRVQSHREEDRAEKDGSVTRYVFLTVAVELVQKGDGAKPGESIQARCWAVVQEPRDGVVWDAGHHSIPGDGGRAKLYLAGRVGDAWEVIYPNGVELLDSTPPLRFPRATAPGWKHLPRATPRWPSAPRGPGSSRSAGPCWSPRPSPSSRCSPGGGTSRQSETSPR